MVRGPKAPRDPEKKRSGFYLIRDALAVGEVRSDGTSVRPFYLDNGRMIGNARMVGNITDEKILELLRTAAGFRRLVHSIGVTVESDDPQECVDFAFQMYGKKVPHSTGTTLHMTVCANGSEHVLVLDGQEWSQDDEAPGQFRFSFEKAGRRVRVSVKLYLQDGFEAPEPEEEYPVPFGSPEYRAMIARSLVQAGDCARIRQTLEKARRGEEVTLAFIGGSITQGAGAAPIHTECYAYQTFKKFCALAGRGTEENIRYVKAGVGGTPSELGMLRYERDVQKDGTVEPDIVVVEFAVNDAGDETGGECYDSLVRKILCGKNRPAVILLFAVFSNDWNLQDRLSAVGTAYDLPMVSIRDAVVEQFYKRPGEGRVISKSQFFYDIYHPTNAGHTVMADALLYLFETADKACDTGKSAAGGRRVPEDIRPPFGDGFWQVKLLDRSQNAAGARIGCGSFCGTDGNLQAVEMDRSPAQVKQFPYNWMHTGTAGTEPFVMEITCTSLILIFKDSASEKAGRAEVYADGEKVLTADPRVNGWVHCNPVICFRDWERRTHHICVQMCPGEEDKEFTILGFGYVE